MKDGRESIGDFALKGGGDYLGHFGTGRSHGVGEGAVVYLTQQQECNLHIINVRYSVNRLDYLVPELIDWLIASQGDFHYHGVWVDRDILREARDGFVRPRLCKVDSQRELEQVLFQGSEGCLHVLAVAN